MPDTRGPIASRPGIAAQDGQPKEAVRYPAEPGREECEQEESGQQETTQESIGQGASGQKETTQEECEQEESGQEESGQEETEELYEHFVFVADRGQSLLRIDRWLADRLQHTSRNRIQTAAQQGSIRVNGSPVRSNYRLKPFDRVSIVLPYPRHESEILPEAIPLVIPYEDDDLLLVDKPAGMVVHPGHGNWTGTLVNALAHHLRHDGLFARGDERAGLVHRIDKDTSGLLVVAKSERAQLSLARQFFDHSVERRYTALVWGNFEEEQGTVRGHIGRDVRDRTRMAVYPGGEQGKHAVTHYRVLRRYGYVTLLECRLETGRTHQIRVHMAHIGHPLFNDARYGGDRILRGTTFARYRQFVENLFRLLPRQALHARTLGFEHPAGERMHFESPLPADLQLVLDRWEEYTVARETPTP